MKMTLDEQVSFACRRLLSQMNRDSSTSTYGCFDRRFWAWKMTDFPEATFQRNLANLAWYLKHSAAQSAREMIGDALIAGLLYTAKIQHRDGSFDQAYPFERSYGATGFLLPDLISAYQEVRSFCDEDQKKRVEACLSSAARFIAGNTEKHSLISNHLAGAALGLLKAGSLFDNMVFTDHGKQLIETIISNQSGEGWFPEYGGADPGYQTLCVHYLAQIFKLEPTKKIEDSLEKSLDFLQYFVHPDGTFGGEYGSRRTEVYYPGGIALLADKFPIAAAIHKFMLESIENLRTVTLIDIDMGNTAPLLSSAILALKTGNTGAKADRLPHQSDQLSKTFTEAGITIQSTDVYYTVLGASNGGVLKIFDKKSKTLFYDDCGALGLTSSGKMITTQSTCLDNVLTINENKISCESDFFTISNRGANPINYLALRALNLTLMRINFLNEVIKKLMVRWLIKTGDKSSLNRHRDIEFRDTEIGIRDTFSKSGNLKLKSLRQGGKFNAIHMASSRYYSGPQFTGTKPEILNYQSLNMNKPLKTSKIILFGPRAVKSKK
ncbi:MAG TPA: hypothetical protein VMW28_04440 [Pelolinea sp.]|nr:hypothetical protein [Pelolinea sp.]